MKLTFITGNKYKLQSAMKALAPYGIEVEQVKLETPEIQSESSREIAEYSAKYAAEKLQKPVVVSDVYGALRHSTAFQVHSQNT